MDLVVTPRAGVWIEISWAARCPAGSPVTPRAGVWIEIGEGRPKAYWGYVTPRAGVWIEMGGHMKRVAAESQSLPVRECGLKFSGYRHHRATGTSLPVRECGLKFWQIVHEQLGHQVTPRAGVWIEIVTATELGYLDGGHSPCGSVD